MLREFIDNAVSAIAVVCVALFTALFAFGIFLVAMAPVWIALAALFVIYKLLA